MTSGAPGPSPGEAQAPEDRGASDPREAAEGGATRLLWTAGWDSTFQLLRLLLSTKRSVEPYYVLDPHRRSVRFELLAMDAIRSRLASEFPEAASRLGPVRFEPRDAGTTGDEVHRAWLALGGSAQLGGQYAWLARFRSGLDLWGLQLAVHRDDRAARLLAGRTVPVGAGHQACERLPAHLEGEPIWTLFGGFDFPLLDWSKQQMRAHSDQQGWGGCMKLTWFCHRPSRRGSPCGACGPCRDAVREGLADRLPALARLRARLRV